MKRTLSFLPVLLLALSLTAACMHVPDNTLPLDQRSMVIDSPADADRILSKARMVESDDPALNHIKVLYLSGTPYEMGFQHGRLNYAGCAPMSNTSSAWRSTMRRKTLWTKSMI